MIFMKCVLVSLASARARSTTASCTWRKGTPVAPAVGMRAAEHWLFAFCALGTTFCTLWARGVWSAASVLTQAIGLAHRTAGLGALVAPPKGAMLGMVPSLAWPSNVLATRTRRVGTARTPCARCRHCLHRLAALRTYCTGWAQPHGFVFGMVRVFFWPSHLLATCTRRIRTALTPCAWFRPRLQWFAALWADFAGIGRCTGRAQPDRFVFGVVRALVWPLYFLATRTWWIGTALAPRAWCRCWF